MFFPVLRSSSHIGSPKRRRPVPASPGPSAQHRPATDAFGRRPLLILCQSASLLRCLALAASPTVRRVVGGTLLRGFCMSVLFVAAQASLGDLFKSQPQLYGRFVSLFMMTMPLSGVLTPLIGRGGVYV